MTGIENTEIKKADGSEPTEEDIEFVKADNYCQMCSQVGSLLLANTFAHHSMYFQDTDKWKAEVFKAIDEMTLELKNKIEQDMEHARQEMEDEKSAEDVPQH